MKILKMFIACSLLIFVFANSVSASSAERFSPDENQTEKKSKKDKQGSIVKNGVKYDFIVAEGKTEKEAEEFYKISMDAVLNLEKSVQNSETVSPMIVVDPDPSGIVLRTSNNNFWINTYSTLKTSFTAILDGVIMAVGFKYATTATQQAAIGTLSSMGSSSVASTSGPDYTSTKLMKFYHSVYKKYVLQEYITSYSDSARTQVREVDFGPLLFEENGYIRDVKW